ncbi:AAA family ATPase [Candidatus Microgenomates bacterium]|nr:MAG: AAA family ATPase [Candidatus Microgenomates bacterium]
MDPQNINNPPSNPPVQNPGLQIKQTTNDQIRLLGEKIEKSSLPDDVRHNLIERVQRLALIRASSGYLSANYIIEYENTSAYINYTVNLPWDKKSQDILDLVGAKKVLDGNHYGLVDMKDRILEYLASIILNLQHKEHILRAPILCLVGLAGTGKTTLASSIAQALGRKFERIPFGGMGDARTLRGQSRAFADAEPGLVIKKLIHAQTKNSVILLDELDRVSQDARADIMGVLVELLDPEQNKTFTDHYIDYPFDLSEVLFISTANNTSNISTAVLDRLEIIQMPSYSDAEKIVIAKDYLFKKTRTLIGLLDNQLTIDDALWPNIIRPLGFDSGIRSLERTIEGICRKTARLIVEGKAQSVRITAENIKEFLPK